METTEAILIGSDEAGFALKEVIKDHLRLAHDARVVDLGCDDGQSVDYPDVAEALAERVSRGGKTRGVLICGTGIGMAIAANKVKGTRCALAHSDETARLAREHNDANVVSINAQVLTMGARVIGPELAKHIVDAWMRSEFVGGASARKVAKIDRLDARHPRQAHPPVEA